MDQPWYIAKGERVAGPLAREDVEALAAAGQLGPDDRVWVGPGQEWVPGSRFAPPRVPPPAAAVPPVRRFFVRGHDGGPNTAAEVRALLPADRLRRAEFRPEGEGAWQPAAAIPELRTTQETLDALKRRWQGVGNAAIFAAALLTFAAMVVHHWAFIAATRWEGVERNSLEEMGRIAGVTGLAAGLLVFAVRVAARVLTWFGVPDPLTRPGGRRWVRWGVAALAVACASCVVWMRQNGLSNRHYSWTADVRRGSEAQGRGDHKGAVSSYTAALDVAETPALYVLRGRSHLAAGHPAEATADLTRALVLRPHEAQTLRLRAAAFDAAGDAAAAAADRELATAVETARR